MYTEGPWKVISVSNQPHGHTHAIFMEDVALCDVLEYDIHPDEVEANAHLIAAAPDMYEALKGLEKRYSTFAMPDKELSPEFLAVRKARAKAEVTNEL